MDDDDDDNDGDDNSDGDNGGDDDDDYDDDDFGQFSHRSKKQQKYPTYFLKRKGNILLTKIVLIFKLLHKSTLISGDILPL